MAAFSGGAKGPRAPGRVGRSAPARRSAPAQNPIYDPTRQLSGRSLQSAAKSLTDLQTQPQITQLARQIAANNRAAAAAQQRVGGFYTQYGQNAQNALAAQRAIADQTNQALAGIGAQTQAQIGAAGDRAQQSLAPLEAKGLDGGSFAALAQEIAAQKGVAAQNSGAARAFGAQQGGNYQGLTANAGAVGALRGTEGLSQLSNALAQQNVKPAADLADAITNRGALMAKNVGALRDSERNYGLALGTLGLNQQRAADTAANNRANQQIKVRGQDLNAQAKRDAQALSRADFIARYGISPEALAKLRNPGQWLQQHAPIYRTKAGANRAGAVTPQQRNASWSQIAQAVTAATQLRGQRLQTPQIRQALNNGYYLQNVTKKDAYGNTVTTQKRMSVPRITGAGSAADQRTLINAALDIAVNGYLSPANVRALHAAGLTIGSRYRLAPPAATTAPVPSLGLGGASPFG